MNDATPWPPLIPPARAPWWMRVRDALLTLAAWFVLLWVLRDALLSLLAGVSPEAAERTTDWLEHRLDPLFGSLVPVHPRLFWHALGDYLIAAAGFVAWLVVWAWVNRARLQRQPPAPGSAEAGNAPPSLPVAEEFAAAGLPEDEALWKSSRHLHVQFDTDGRIRPPRGAGPGRINQNRSQPEGLP